MTSGSPSTRDRLHSIISGWSNSLRSTFSRNNIDDSLNQNLVPQSSNYRTNSVDHTAGGRVQTDYTELMDGSIPCPSCNGSGLIPKELESTLIALIPVNDERLKPNKTWLHILLWVAVCVIIGGTILFLLMPKTVSLSSNSLPIVIVDVYNKSDEGIDFFFMNHVNITSGNYLPVYVVNLTSIIISKFQPWSSTDFVGTGENNTLSTSDPLPLYHNTRELMFNNSVELKGVTAKFCQAPFSLLTPLYVSLRFDISATIQYYYGHKEQITLSMQQEVCCIPTGNCTSPTSY